jgi:hypothetical protein
MTEADTIVYRFGIEDQETVPYHMKVHDNPARQ